MLNDLSPMPFGKHKGQLMQDVPAHYLHWLWVKSSFDKIKLNEEPEKQHQKDSFFVARYISDNLTTLKDENEDLIWT